jgi:hypothetical protein
MRRRRSGEIVRFSKPVGVLPTRGGQPSAFGQNVIIPMPQPRHGLRQIGCGNQWHQRSAGTADVPTPDDLEWPRRAIVGAIVVIGGARLATFAGGPGVFQPQARSIAAIRKDRPKAVLQSNVPGQNSFGIKPCPARSDRKLTTIPGRPLTIKISVLKWGGGAENATLLSGLQLLTSGEKSDDCAIID